MIIKFRYHRGGLKESLATMRTFTSWEQLLAWLVHESYDQFIGAYAFSEEDIVIDEKQYHDKRIGWKDARWVCIKKYNGKIFNLPCPIGTVATEFCEPTDLSWQN